EKDDGIGVKILSYIDACYRFPENVELIDGGTCGATLNTAIIDKNWLIIIDALNVPGEPGEIRVLAGESFIHRPAQTKMSPHQVGFLDLIQLMRFEGTGPEEIELIGIIPKDISHSIDMSTPVLQTIEPVTRQVMELLKKRGIVPERRVPPRTPNYWWMN
ncbi:MAG: hydrogenase maturation protease, partial [bacterium]